MTSVSDTKAPCDGSCSGSDPRKHDATLAFGRAPVTWRSRPPELKPFICDYDLPGGARVNALYYPMSLDGFREKLFANWTTAEGEPLVVSAPRRIDANGIPVDVYELHGTHAPGPLPEHGRKLIMGYLHAPGGAWTVRFFGPMASVDSSRAAFIRWLETARLVEET